MSEARRFPDSTPPATSLLPTWKCLEKAAFSAGSFHLARLPAVARLASFVVATKRIGSDLKRLSANDTGDDIILMKTALITKCFAEAKRGSFNYLFPLLAQVSIDGAVDSFLVFLAKIFLILGALVIAYGGYLIHQGRVSEGLLGLLGGFILALAIPLMKLLLQMAGV